MKSSTSTNVLPKTRKELSSKSVLMRWLNEVTCFRQNYYHIDEYVGKQLKNLCLSTRSVAQYNSQCSLNSLIVLQTEMRAELERLLLDMNKCGQDLVKLKAHTLQLSRLNKQAQARLLLSSTSAS